MTYYVTCITKHPNHDDPRHRITHVGTTTTKGLILPSKVWNAQDVVNAIDFGRDTFWCSDKRGDLVKVATVAHLNGKYLKTENDGIAQDNLLSQKDC